MSSNYLAKGLKRSALTVALGLSFVGGVQARNVGEGLFNAPIDGGSGKLATQIAGDGKVVDDIAQR